ncbi:B3 DNA-binding domain protein [Medicago truncatula]|uniref:B3 DNA-binding domain protein n=2 Tax=Medicago truncatula TaxID=3880 RepID=A0A072UMM3_MEDTR|nr:B3 DNA-binding domain protein [Medicago truncatula]
MHTIPSMNQPHEGYSSSLMGQSHVPFIIQTTPQLVVEREEDKKFFEAKRCKIAREQRKQILKRIRSKSASKFTEETSKRSPIYREIQERTPHVFYSPDGKRFEEILTKKLRKSDVKNYGRIVLPKREVEEKLPAPSREGIEVIFKDIYSGREWKLKLKYWINGTTRMYILENTGDLVNHYKLCMEDYLGLYEDELKNLYLCTKKACDLSTVDLFPCANQGKEKEPPDQSVAQETNNTPMSPILVDGTDGGGDDDDEQESSLDEFYESLDNIFDVS